MTDIRKDGGPAFPLKDDYGMSLRDYFAAQALPALLATQGAPGNQTEEVQRYCAMLAYRTADAMLAARGAP